MPSREAKVETYAREHDIGPLMEVQEARGGGASFTLEVGWWGLTVRLDLGDVVRLHTQLGEILSKGRASNG